MPQLDASALAPGLAPSRPVSAAVTDALRQRILCGGLAEGVRLRQEAVAADFGVSQMIAREAFKALVAEGFLAAEPRRGVRVMTMTVEEASEMTQLRCLIEAQALGWAIPHLTLADLKRAGDLLDALDEAGETDEIIALNARFHDTLYIPSGKARTLAMIAGLRRNFERYLRFAWEETRHLEQSQDEHRQLLALCATRDAVGARRLLEAHIRATGALLVRCLVARDRRR